MKLKRSEENLLRQLEVRLLQPDVRRSSDEGAELLADEFIEFGSSGRVYDKEQEIAGLKSEPATRRSLTGFKTRVLAPGVVLATYRAVQNGPSGKRYSLRCSIWKSINGRWRMVFHQGTRAGRLLRSR